MINTNKPTVWLNEWEFPIRQIPLGLRPWVLASGSMTKRLRRAGQASFHVDVLKQQWELPTTSEARLIAIPNKMPSLVREVQLFCNNACFIFAHTVVPKTTMQGSCRRLHALLNKRPIGDILFSDPNMRRSPLQLAKLTPEHIEYQWAVQNISERPEFLWARRSVFYLSERPLIVNEIFFPIISQASALR